MPQFTVVRFPCLNEQGVPILLPPNQWQVRSDLKTGRIRLQGDNNTRVLELRDVLAVEVGEEKEVTAVGATLGRMALTGIGAALVSRGRRGGFGAGLLDLSVRGSVKHSAVTGAMVWPDTTILSFGARGEEIEHLVQHLPEEAFEEEALEEAQHRLDLLQRMVSDGRRALEEMASEVAQVASHVRELHARVEHGRTFTERDEAREEALEMQDKLATMRALCTALQAELGIPTHELMANAPGYSAALPPPVDAKPEAQEGHAPKQPVAPLPSRDASTGNSWTTQQWIGLGIALIVIFVVVKFVL